MSPLAALAAPEPALEPALPPAAPQRILLVDDEARMRRSLRRLLEAPGREFAESETGLEAMQRLGAGDFDLVVLDVGLPDVSGLDVLGALEAGASPVHAIVVSASGDLDVPVRALRSGAVDFLRKPDDLDRLPALVDRTLERRRLQAQNREMAARLAQSERLHRLLVEHSPDIVYALDAHGCFAFLNPRVESVLGYARGELLGRHHAEIVHEDDRARAAHALAERRRDGRAATDVELRLRVPGTAEAAPLYRVVSVSAVGVYDGGGAEAPGGALRFVGTQGVMRDITERKRAEATIAFQALHDQLTQLPNRRLFRDHLELALAQAARRGRMVGVMFVDLDRFKPINDTYGHRVGDDLLRAFAQRLRGCVRAGDTVGRQGGDEFTVLLPDLVQADDALVLVRKLLAALDQPFEIDGRALRVTASVGIAVYPRDGADADQLMRNADVAMYVVKESGRNGGRVFAPSMNAEFTRRLELEQDLRHAVERGELVLHFQPRVAERGRRLVGAEALVRWHHPVQGLLGPTAFVELAEESGQIFALSDWVLERSCAQLAVWHALGHRELRVSVNLAPVEFARSDLVERVLAPLRRHGLPGRALEVEITETSLLQDQPEVADKLRRLRALGIDVAIDDFGTRYSSLNYLRRLPVSTLKIDQSFVHDLTAERPTAPIVHAILGIARGFGLHVVAEGVETEHQRQALAELGCDEMQGFLFGRPGPAGDVLGGRGA